MRVSCQRSCEDPWRREDFEDEYEEDDQEEAAAQVKTKPEELPVDAEWVADEIIPNLEACAEEEEEQPAQRSPVESVVSHPFRTERGKDGAPLVSSYGQKGKLGEVTPACAVTDSRGGCGRIRGGRFRRGGTTSIGPVSLPPPIPLFSESTCDGKS
jgi:hypothetical protein